MHTTPFNLGLNDAIVQMTTLVLPDGYEVSDEAPRSFEELNALLDSGQRLVVWSGGSQATIYGDPQVNYAFRAWHDWCHWRGRHDFTLAGETAVCELQCRQIVEHFGESEDTRAWRAIIRAEIVGQATYHQRHKRFPEDQRGFVREYLRDPEAAVAWPPW